MSVRNPAPELTPSREPAISAARERGWWIGRLDDAGFGLVKATYHLWPEGRRVVYFGTHELTRERLYAVGESLTVRRAPGA